MESSEWKKVQEFIEQNEQWREKMKYEVKGSGVRTSDTDHTEQQKEKNEIWRKGFEKILLKLINQNKEAINIS